jgi:23S rRNA C2498 (ribose-2'-O)-methylase RlmM
MDDPAVEFVCGDAFAFEPPAGGVDWMVSDVAAYPERCVELLERWCGNGWARYMVVTMKFTGDTPDFVAVEEARHVAEGHGFRFRAMHHFSNKNEVSLMIMPGGEGE